MPKAKGAKAGGKKTGPRVSYMDPRDTTRTLGQEGITKHTADLADRVPRLVVPSLTSVSARMNSVPLFPPPSRRPRPRPFFEHGHHIDAAQSPHESE